MVNILYIDSLFGSSLVVGRRLFLYHLQTTFEIFIAFSITFSGVTVTLQLALSFAVDSMINMRGRVGRHQSNILKTIFCELNKRNINLRNLDDLTELRHIASNRNLWRNLYIQY